MRLALILIIGALLISATWAWSNTSAGEAQSDFTQVQVLPTKKTTITKTRTTTAIVSTEAGNSAGVERNSAGVASNGFGTDVLEQTRLDSHATSLDAARQQARSTAGQSNPFKSLDSAGSLPAHNSLPGQSHQNVSKIIQTGHGGMVPPPPPSVSNPFGDAPPPPAGQLNSGLNLGELPTPPENAHLNPRVELVGIVGDRAIFNIKDNLLRRKHKWPKSFTLTIGQTFDGMKLVAVKDESAIVEEDGQTITKPLPVVK